MVIGTLSLAGLALAIVIVMPARAAFVLARFFCLAVVIVFIVAAFLGIIVIVVVVTAFLGQPVFPEEQPVIVALARFFPCRYHRRHRCISKQTLKTAHVFRRHAQSYTTL
jgi:hypothetical protein